MFINTTTFEYPLTAIQIIAANPEISFPIPFELPEGYLAVKENAQPDFNKATQKLVENAPLFIETDYFQSWSVAELTEEEIASTKAKLSSIEAMLVASRWEEIKRERSRRQKLGVKVGDAWFHSDADSRMQHLELAALGENITLNSLWKTKTHTGTVFVTMTKDLICSILQATVFSDMSIFNAAENHFLLLKSSECPIKYSIAAGWPVSFEDVF